MTVIATNSTETVPKIVVVETSSDKPSAGAADLPSWISPQLLESMMDKTLSTTTSGVQSPANGIESQKSQASVSAGASSTATIEADNGDSFQAWLNAQMKEKLDGAARFAPASNHTSRKTVRIPQNVVGLILGKRGQTVMAIKDKTGTEISIDQSTKNQGYSEMTISADADLKVMAAEQEIARHLEGFQNGKLQRQNSETPRDFVPGHNMITGNTPRGNNMAGLQDTFEIPKKYLGLFIGKGGEAIKRYRQQASMVGMEIRVDQDKSNPESGGTVVIKGASWDMITKMKAEMSQNLFKAINHLNEQEAQGNLMSERYLLQNPGAVQTPQKGHEMLAAKGLTPRGPYSARSGPYSARSDVSMMSSSHATQHWGNQLTAPSSYGPTRGASAPANNYGTDAGASSWLADLLGTAPESNNQQNQHWGMNQSTTTQSGGDDVSALLAAIFK